MIKTKAKITGFLMTVLLALSAPLVYADNPNGGDVSGGQPAVSDDQSSPGQVNHEWKHGHWGRHLNLTDDQKKQLKDIGQKQRETMKATFEQIKANREALNKEIILATPDMNKVNDLQAQLKTLQAQMMDNHLNSTLEVKKILTPEQFGKYLELQKKMFAGRFHRGEGEHGKGCHKYCDFRGHWMHHRCHRHHHGHRGYQHDSGYGYYHKHWGNYGDNDGND